MSVKNGENNGLLAGVPFLSPSRAQIPPSPFPFNACHAGHMLNLAKICYYNPFPLYFRQRDPYKDDRAPIKQEFNGVFRKNDRCFGQ